MAQAVPHPLFLTFSLPELEQSYAKQRLSCLFQYVDFEILKLQVLLNFAYFGLIVRVNQIPYHWSQTAYPVALAANLVFLYALRRNVYLKHRNLLIITFKAVLDIIALHGLPNWSPPLPVKSVGTFMTHLLLTSGVAAQNWSSIGWPLLLQFHIFYCMFSTVLGVFKLAPHTCQVLEQTALGRHYIHSAWQLVSKISWYTIRFGRLSILSAGNEKEVTLPAEVGECWAMLSFVQIMLGFVLPTTLVFVLEKKSRLYFLREVHGLSPGGDTVATRVLNRFAELCLTVLFAFSTWEVLVQVKYARSRGSDIF